MESLQNYLEMLNYHAAMALMALAQEFSPPIPSSHGKRNWEALNLQELALPFPKDLIKAVNKAAAGDLLLLNVELDENNTGYNKFRSCVYP